ncbi:MAG: hypothetical protein P4L85_19080 [Paludisphaera borealis]|uniref:tetratricopeptide repeat protein n=1 Tax=Paludisphaera borealis TaxID=1387353 RepID=UPI002840B45E|nr:hypothetical protein [Paludisphaera borealis]MDR3621462.1 hypothetical protein [Paludisphaera borealis]
MSRTGRTAAIGVAAAIGIMVSGATGYAQDKPPETVAESRPISKAEALEFGKGMADAIVRLDSKAVEQAMDTEAMLEAASSGVKAPPPYREGFLNGARKTLERDGPPLLVELRPTIQAGANVRVTKALEWQGRPAFLFRLIRPEGIVSYLLFMLDRRPDGRIRAVDYYSLSTGELASQGARRMYLAGVAQINRGIVDRLLSKDHDLFKHIGDVKRMAVANREGREQEALTIYDALPEELKNEKIFQVLRCAAAQKTGDDAKYLEAIQDFARRFPGDPASDFQMVDGYLLMKQPEKSLEYIGKLEKALSEDAYLKVLRGNILTLLKRPDDALAAYRAAIVEERDLRPAYDGLLGVAVERKRFGEVAELLDTLESVFDEEIGDLSEVGEFAEFVASPEGKAWAEKHEKQEKQKPGDKSPKP